MAQGSETQAPAKAYWRRLVIGCEKWPRAALASRYYVTMNLHHFVGSRGVEIVGASRRVRGDVHKS